MMRSTLLLATIVFSMGCATADWRLHASHHTPVYADNKILLFSSDTEGVVAYNVSTQAKLWTQPTPCWDEVNNSTRLFRRTGPSTISYSCGTPSTYDVSLTSLASLDDATGTITVLQPIGGSGASWTDTDNAEADAVSGTYCVFTWPPVCLLGETKAVWSPAFDQFSASAASVWSRLHQGTLLILVDRTPYVFNASTGTLRGIAGGVVPWMMIKAVTFYESLTVLIQADAFIPPDILAVTVINNTDAATLVANHPLAGAPVSTSFPRATPMPIPDPVVFFNKSAAGTLVVGLVVPVNNDKVFRTWSVSLAPSAPRGVVQTVFSVPVVSYSDCGCAETAGYVLCGTGGSSSPVLFHAASGTVVDTSAPVSMPIVTSFETIGNMLIAQGPPTASASVNDVWTAAFDRKSGAFLWLRTLNSIDGTIGYDAADDCVVLKPPTHDMVCIGING